MNNLKTCLDNESNVFNIWLFHIDKVPKLTGIGLKDICFAKAEDILLTFLYYLPLYKILCPSIKEKM